MGLLDDTITPPASAYGAEPFSVAEIDAHPDSARLWATILAMRAEHDGTESEKEKAYEEGYASGYADCEMDCRDDDA